MEKKDKKITKEIRYTDFTQVGMTIDKLMSSLNLTGKIKKYNLSKIWGEIVGQKFEKRSYPSTLVKRTLTVACENAQVTSELLFSKRLIIQRLKTFTQSLDIVIDDIIFSHKIWNNEEKN